MIAKLLLSFRKRGLLNLMTMSEFCRELGNKFLRMRSTNWPKQPKTTSATSDGL